MESECTLFDQPVYPYDKKGKGEKVAKNKKRSFRKSKKVVATAGAGILLGTFASFAGDHFVTDGQEVHTDHSDFDDADLNLSNAANTGAVYIDESSISGSDEQLAEVAAPAEDAVEAVADDVAMASVVPDGNISVASNVNDDMTFNEAFSSARTEVGAGGAFEWRDNLYATYTYEEWNEMDEGERESFAEHFNVSSEDDLHSYSSEYFADAYADTVDDVAVLDGESDVEVLGVLKEDDALSVDGEDVFLVDVESETLSDDYAQLQHNEADIEDYGYDDMADPGMDTLDMP